MKTYTHKSPAAQWFVLDAKGVRLGHLATKASSLLRGKHLATFTPGLNPQQHVIVLNADKIDPTIRSLVQKVYYRHTGYPGGIRQRTLEERLEREPTRLMEDAIAGMLPKNRLGAALIKNLHVYSGETHPHPANATTVPVLKN